jgi:hypothetical protein
MKRIKFYLLVLFMAVLTHPNRWQWEYDKLKREFEYQSIKDNGNKSKVKRKENFREQAKFVFRFLPSHTTPRNRRTNPKGIFRAVPF